MVVIIGGRYGGTQPHSYYTLTITHLDLERSNVDHGRLRTSPTIIQTVFLRRRTMVGIWLFSG